MFSCLCTKADFHNGIHDCAQAACAANLFPTVTNYVNSICASKLDYPRPTLKWHPARVTCAYPPSGSGRRAQWMFADTD